MMEFLEKYASGLIALFTVVASVLVSLYIAKKQNRLGREQMLKSSQIAIAQVRANNISAARIEWIQKLRPLLAQMISKIDQLDSTLIKLKSLTEEVAEIQSATPEQVILKDSLVKEIETVLKIDIKPTFNQIKLFLNKKNESHANLIDIIDSYIRNSFDSALGKSIVIEITEDDVIEYARLVLKDAWEQAKTEVENNG